MTAKKEAKKRRLAAKRKRQTRHQSGQAALTKRLERSALSANAELHIEPRGQHKMSEVILEFAKPLLGAAHGHEEYRGALGLAITAWTVSLMPEPMWKDVLPKPIGELAALEDVSDDLEQLFTDLVYRRRRLYPHVERFVLDYEVTRSRGAPRLDVVSTLVPTQRQWVGAG